MDSNGTSTTANTRAQPSIRSFFQPRPQPSYTAPPSLPVSEPATTPSTSVPSSTSSDPKSKLGTSKTTLPKQASISLISQTHVQPLRRINSLLLPIHYPDSFYRNILLPDQGISFSRVISWTDNETKVVGGIVCRLDPALASDSTPEAPNYIADSYDIYIQSLALLSPYRGKGLVTAALNVIIAAATSQNHLRIGSLYAHVWTENEEALEWYSARGFKPEGAVINGYYRRLKPDTAYLFRRRFAPTDHLQAGSLPTPQHVPAPLKSPALQKDGMRPPPLSARSFQEQGPEREWNDLPEDLLSNTLLKPASQLASKEGSAASSRSSSQSRPGKEKKKRVYPAAALQG